MLSSGQRLRGLREELGLTIRDVEAASGRIAARHGSEDFAISPSRLSDIETKGLLPNAYRLYSLAVIYRRDLRELLGWYGIDLSETAADLALSEPPKSHIAETLDSVRAPGKSSLIASRVTSVPVPEIGTPARFSPPLSLAPANSLARSLLRPRGEFP